MPATTETNTKPSYTNGPFCLTEEDGELLIVAPDPELPGCYGLLAQILDCDFPEQALANGYLLAAAPALLAVLKVLRERHQIDEPHHADLCEFCMMADAAIAKAEGAS